MNLYEIYKKFPEHEDCLKHLEQIRWKGIPVCPYCNSQNTTPMKKGHRHHCNNCNTSFSVIVRTIFHKTKIDLQKWFLGISLILDAKKGISSRQLSRHLNINKDTAWYLAMRVRKAMIEQRELMQGIVEMDETYIGGKPRKGTGEKNKRGRGTKKTPVVGMVERNGQVKAKSFNNKKLDKKNLNSLVRKNVDITNATLITDEFKGYIGIKTMMPHEVIDHTIWYVNGEIHTNTIESFWALLKRGIIGQYHKVSLRHLDKYIDEFSYRWNNRLSDDIFALTLKKAVRVI